MKQLKGITKLHPLYMHHLAAGFLKFSFCLVYVYCGADGLEYSHHYFLEFL